MKIQVLKSTDIEKSLSELYTQSFNNAFKKNFKFDNLEKKYLNNFLGYSYHCIAIDRNKVAGACSCIPQSYNFFGNEYNVALLVDVFILEEYRTDPLLLKKMYSMLKESILSM